MMTPIMHDSNEWQEVQRKLSDLKTDVTAIDGRVKAIESKQADQHRENHQDIAEMRMILLGEPGDEENIGVVRKMDIIMAYGRSTVFWGKVLAGLLTLIIAYAMWRDAHAATGTGKADLPFLGTKSHNPVLSFKHIPQDAQIPTNP